VTSAVTTKYVSWRAFDPNSKQCILKTNLNFQAKRLIWRVLPGVWEKR
jgi:hypothetical protein